MQHDFGYLIKEYELPFILKASTETGYLTNGRIAPKIAAEPEERKGVILPLSPRDLQYGADGTYTRQDRKLIVIDPIVIKSVVEIKGLDYVVDAPADWDDYSDFHVYMCRRSSKK